MGHAIRNFLCTEREWGSLLGIFVYEVSGGKIFGIVGEWYESGSGPSEFLWKMRGASSLFQIFVWMECDWGWLFEIFLLRIESGSSFSRFFFDDVSGGRNFRIFLDEVSGWQAFRYFWWKK